MSTTVRTSAGAELTRFALRTRDVLGVEQLAVTDSTGIRLAGSGLPLDDDWITIPIHRPRRPAVGLLHVLPGPQWRLDESAQALKIAAETAAALVAPAPHGRADLPEVVAASALNRLALAATDYPGLLNGIAAAIAPAVDVSKVGIALWSEPHHYLQSLPRSFGASDEMTASSQVDEADRISGAARAWRTGVTIYSNEPRVDLPDFRDWLDAFGIQQLMSTPLFIGEQKIGVLHVANPGRPFDIASVAAVESVAPFVASCVATFRHQLRLRHNEIMSEVLTRAVTAVAMGESLDAVAQTEFPHFCGAADIQLLTVIISGDTSPHLAVYTGRPDQTLQAEFLAEVIRARMSTRIQMRRPTRVGDAGSSTLHVPVVAAGRIEATLSVLRTRGIPFSEPEQAAIGRLANVVALARMTERYHQERARRERIQERQRIADDLHDHVAQALYAGQVALQSAIEDLGPDAPLRDAVIYAQTLLARSETSLRDAIQQLETPTGRDDLTVRLRAMATEVEREFGVTVAVTTSRQAAQRAETQTCEATETLLRATRELLVNAAKHAGAGRIAVIARARGNRLVITVADDGAGFPPGRRREGYGLRSTRRNLRAVGGSLRISHYRGGLTRVVVSVATTPDATTAGDGRSS